MNADLFAVAETVVAEHIFFPVVGIARRDIHFRDVEAGFVVQGEILLAGDGVASGEQEQAEGEAKGESGFHGETGDVLPHERRKR